MSSQESFKIILLGETEVGKTSLISQYVNGQFNPQTPQSLTSFFIKKEIAFPDRKLNFEIWDVAGANQYRKVSLIFVKDAKAIILMYDVTNENSFKELKDFWYENIKDKNSPLYVVGNKCDLNDKKVTDEEGRAFADSIGAKFFTVSAKDNIRLNELFEKIGEELLK